MDQSDGRLLDRDYRLTDADGAFSFRRRVFWFIQYYVGIPPVIMNAMADMAVEVHAEPVYRSVREYCDEPELVQVRMPLDAMQNGTARCATTPRSTAREYVAAYARRLEIARQLLDWPQAARHHQYRQLLEYRDAMERKAAEWRERLEHAADEPVLDRPPPP